MRVLLPVALLLSVALLAQGAAPDPFTATPAPHATTDSIRAYPVLDVDGVAIGTQAWRVVNGTGNCCENHVVVDAEGRIFDVGGSRPAFSEDEGLTWSWPDIMLEPRGGEGAGAIAPNGDFVGVVWEPGMGDRVVTYKREAATGAWRVSQVALHTPFFDRPWVGVAQGPFQVAGTTYPYAVLLSGGAPVDTTYVSFDGVTYALPSTHLTSVNVLPRAPRWLDQPAQPWADWSQPTSHARTAPLPSGGALLGTALFCFWTHFATDGTMRCHVDPTFRWPPSGILRVDSLGRLHVFEQGEGGFTHHLSVDGGRSYARTWHPLPPDLIAVSWDAVANGALDAAAVSILAEDSADVETARSRTLVYKLDDLSGAGTRRILQLGEGDLHFGHAFTASSAPRFDFVTVGMLPDGRVVTSFGDAAHPTPRLAIEV